LTFRAVPLAVNATRTVATIQAHRHRVWNAYAAALPDCAGAVARLLINLDRGRHVRSPAGYEALAPGAFAHVDGTVVAQAFPPYT
jgi:hypothetical protein